MTTVSLPVVNPMRVTDHTRKETTVGNYFVANYPPFGYWRAEQSSELVSALARPPREGTALAVYAHIPFCRKRCHFCYFRVYTDKNSGEIRRYLDAMVRELEMYTSSEVFGGRTPRVIYFGGGTPSYLSAEQLRGLTESMKRLIDWDGAEEITLEAEPGTLNEGKLRAIREMGVTRLSLGIEHFDDHVLEINGRAHRSKEVHRAFAYAREIGFPQINVDLIAGMVEETDERWHETVRKTIEIEPDTVTIYQMEVPYNTTLYQKMMAEGTLRAPVADWATKRRWVAEAFEEFERAGYSVTSATTVVKDPRTHRFMYRQSLFDGTDVMSVGLSAFGHLNGVNYQNHSAFDPYLEAVELGGPPTNRAYALSDEERYIRELALQMKGGSVSASAFARKFGRDPREQFAGAFERWRDEGVLVEEGDRVGLTRAGMLQADRLIHEFFRPVHRTGKLG